MLFFTDSRVNKLFNIYQYTTIIFIFFDLEDLEYKACMAIVIYNFVGGLFIENVKMKENKNYETIFIMKYIVGKCNLIKFFYLFIERF